MLCEKSSNQLCTISIKISFNPSTILFFIDQKLEISRLSKYTYTINRHLRMKMFYVV